MRVTVPTTGEEGLEEDVNGQMGHAPTYTIVDTETGEVRTVENASNHMGGVGMPPEIIARAGTVEDAIKAWQACELPEADEHTDCGHGCGGHH